MADMIMKQCIPQALVMIWDMLSTIWNSNRTFYIAFALFFLIGGFLLRRMRKHHRHY